MISVRLLAATVSLAALSACGTHKSVAPVASNDAAASSRTTNASQSSDQRVNSLYQTAQTPERRQTAYAAPARDVEPISLKPVSAVYQTERDNVRLQPANYQASESSSGASMARVVDVQQGDTVYALGRRFNVHPKTIIAENNLRAPYLLEIGQKIRVPGAASTASVQSATRTQPQAQTQAPARNVRYRVEPGDTLFAISRKTGVSVPLLAQANGLQPPYTLSPGQEIVAPGAQADAAVPQFAEIAPAQQQSLQPRAVETAQSRVASVTSTTSSTPEASAQTQDVAELAKQVSFTQPTDPNAFFTWPVRGAVIAGYGGGDLGKRNDGINIAAPAGTPVRAAADGEVVYRGSELEGFGNLLLVKHADGFVTAYAHNDAMLVKKGDVVRKGQVISKVGKTGSVTTPQLHFEIRQKLKSVDPLSLLETQ